MKNFIKHLSIWIFVFFAGIVSVYVAAQVSSVSIEANIGSFVQYIGNFFVTSDGTPSGDTLFSVDSNGVSILGLARENAGQGLLGVNESGVMVNTRPLSYVTLPDTSDTQQLANNYAYIIPYWDDRSETVVLLPDTCVVGDEIHIQALSLPLDIHATSPMQIIAPYLEGEYAGYGYGNSLFTAYDNYFIFANIGYSIDNGYCESGVGIGYPYDWCSDEWNDELQQSEINAGYGEPLSGYGLNEFPPRFVSFLCIDTNKYLMQMTPLGMNTPGEGFFYDVDSDSGYGDEYGVGSPNPFAP